LVEAKKNSIPSVGIEASPLAHFASRTKVDWTPDPDALLATASTVAERTQFGLGAKPSSNGASDNGNGCPKLRVLSTEAGKLLLNASINDVPLHQTLVLLECLRDYGRADHNDHLKLALAKALVTSVGNLRFGPEVGVTTRETDAVVVDAWLEQVKVMANDLREFKDLRAISSTVNLGDARAPDGLVSHGSISAVICSPPYPNEKEYTRTTRLEAVLLDFMKDRKDLRRIKKGLLRSNTRTVFKGDDDDQWVESNESVKRLVTEIEQRRVDLNKTSGFERLYGRVTKLYFGGMARHLSQIQPLLAPGARLAYVVGDQASFFRVPIRTGTILAEIADSLGYEVEDVELFRTRRSTATREQLREEVVLLQWKGTPSHSGSKPSSASS
jgi:hypothetical protein